MFQNEYRQVNKTKIYRFWFNKRVSIIFKWKKNSIGHLFANYEKLEIKSLQTSKLDISVESVNNDTFLNVFKNNLIESSVKPKV